MPEQTETYYPVSNRQVYELLYEKAEERGFEFKGTGFRANRANTQFMGLVLLDSPENGLSKMIGFRNSTDKSLPVGLVAGAMVMLCTNGMISGEIMNLRRHTKNVHQDLEEIVENVFEYLNPKFVEYQNKAIALKEKEILRPVALEIIADLFFSEKLITSTQMSVLKESIFTDKNFSLPKEKDKPFPVWNVYNLVTDALKHGAPSGYFGNHIQLDNYFEEKLLV